MRDFKKLRVWQYGIELTVKIYQLTEELPKEEKYGLISQITRAAASIPANIAEGSSRNSEKDFRRFLGISLGSSFELETFLVILTELELAPKKQLEELIKLNTDQQRMLSGHIKKLS